MHEDGPEGLTKPLVSLPAVCVAGSLAVAQVAVQRPNEIMRQDGKTVPLAMTIEEISFSAHSDFAQTRVFF